MSQAVEKIYLPPKIPFMDEILNRGKNLNKTRAGGIYMAFILGEINL